MFALLPSPGGRPTFSFNAIALLFRDLVLLVLLYIRIPSGVGRISSMPLAFERLIL